MPSPGVVNNPGGSNSYQSAAGKEEPYGAIERRKVLTRLSPMEKNPALNAPRRAQAAATSKKKPPPEKPIQPHAAQAQEMQDAATRGQPEQPVDPVAQFWQMLASEEGASPLIRQYAAQAAGGQGPFGGDYGTPNPFGLRGRAPVVPWDPDRPQPVPGWEPPPGWIREPTGPRYPAGAHRPGWGSSGWNLGQGAHQPQGYVHGTFGITDAGSHPSREPKRASTKKKKKA